MIKKVKKKHVVDFMHRLVDPPTSASTKVATRPRFDLQQALVQKKPMDEWLGEVVEKKGVEVSPYQGADGLLATLEANAQEYARARLSAVLRGDKYRSLQGMWNDIKLAVNNSSFPKDGRLYIKPATKQQVLDDARTAGRDVDNSTLNIQIVRNHLKVAGGQPLLTARWTFPVGYGNDDLELLRFAGTIGRGGHLVNLFDASPSLLGISHWWQITRNTRDIHDWFNSGELAEFRALQQENFAPHIAILLPGLTARKPYGPRNMAPGVSWFAEQVRTASDLPQASAAAAMGRCIATSMGRYNFPGNVIGMNHGGLVKGVSLITGADLAGAATRNSATSVIVDDDMEWTLDQNRLVSLVPIKGSAQAAFFSSETFYASLVFEDPDRTADAAQLSRLPHMLITCRWAHHLQAKLRAVVGSAQSADEVETQFQQWANRFVLTQTEGVSQELKARHPLRDIQIAVFERPDKPGHLGANIVLVPHYRMRSFKALLTLKGGLVSKKSASK